MLVYLFLGVLQGIFEWLPVSSEGIVAIAAQALSFQGNVVDLALFLHLGTLFAVLVYFRKDWLAIFAGKNNKLFSFLAVSASVSLFIGYLLYQLVKEVTLGIGLLAMMGFALLGTAFLNRKRKSLGLLREDKLALAAGLFQGLAVVPGLSRSASTIFALSLGKLKPEKILKISYMMSVPVILASSFYLFLKNPILLLDAWPALISSFLVGFLTLDYLLKLVKKLNFSVFALIFSSLCFIGALLKWMTR